MNLFDELDASLHRGSMKIITENMAGAYRRADTDGAFLYMNLDGTMDRTLNYLPHGFI